MERTHYSLIDNREIRIFISSTFQDLQNERDYLMSKTFPMLKHLAAKRNVTLTEVDLRWGISHEESENGCIVDVCLKEIENSIPFFIGIIGERYGWCPTKDDVKNTVQANEKYQWVYDDVESGLSITEMEMQYGVLRRTEDINAFFYIKDNTKDENEKLTHLKGEIRNNKRYPVHGYSSIEKLAEQVEADFKQLLDDVFPLQEISVLEMEKISQRSYIRTLSKNYIPDGKSFDILDDFVADNKQQFLVITGKSGLGKSALIANWITRNPKDNIISIFIGNGGSNGNYTHIQNVLRDGLFEICHISEKQQEKIKAIADNKDQLTALWKKVEKIKKPYLVVIDAINQIEDFDNAKLLNWLPIPPNNVKFLFSTLEEDQTMDVFNIRNYPIYTLQPLQKEQQKQLINSYLSSFGKKLSNTQIDLIIDDDQNKNTLALRTLLDELIRYGHYELLNQRIAYYLEADTVDDFYQLLLTQYECDYGVDIVRNTLGLIATSHYGMQENEIQEILKLRQLDWSQFYCAFSSHLINKNGLINFSHNYVKNAVTTKYITNHPNFERHCHQLISDYFEKVLDNRSLQERCFQYDKLGAYDKLSDFLLHYDVIDYLFTNDELELGRYCRILPEKTDGRFDLSFMLHPNQSMNDSEMVYYFNMLVKLTMSLVTMPDLATKFSKASLALYDKHPEWDKDWKILVTYSNLANATKMNGQVEEAAAYFEKLLELIGPENENNLEHLSSSYSDLGDMYIQNGDYDLGIKYHLKALEIANKMSPVDQLQKGFTLRSLGMAHTQLGNFLEAEEYLNQAYIELVQSCGKNSEQVAFVDVTRGNLYSMWGLLEKTGDCLKRALPAIEFFDGENNITTALLYYLFSYYYNQTREVEEAIIYGEKAVKSYKSIGGDNYFELVKCYAQLGSNYALGEQNDKAKAAFDEGERIAKISLSDNPLTGVLFNNFGLFYNQIGNYKEAIVYFKKAYVIYEKISSESYPNKVITNNNIGLAYYNLDDLDNAEEYFNKSYNMAIDLYGEENPNVLTMMNNRSLIMMGKEQFADALELLQKTLQMRRTIFEEENIDDILVYNNMASAYGKLGHKEEAINCAKHSYQLLKDNNALDNILCFTILCNTADILLELQNLPESIKYGHMAEDYLIRNLSEDAHEWSRAYDLLGDCYYQAGDYQKAADYYKKELLWRQKYEPAREQRIERCKDDLNKALKKLGEH